MTRAFACAVLVVITAAPANSHDDAEWIRRGSIKNAIGELCCGPKDCQSIAEGDVAVTPRGYRIKSLNETIPFNEALPLPNIPEAKGLYWRCAWPTPDARKCFFVPHGGS